MFGASGMSPKWNCGTMIDGKPSKMIRWRALLWAALVAAACGLAFHEGMRYGLLDDWDDATFVVNNPHITLNWSNFLFYLCHPFQDLFSPLPMWSLMLDHALWGLRPLGYHLHNLALHILAAWALLATLRRLGVRWILAGLGALLWALNPQKVESVIWVSERKDVLCGLFAFLAVWLFLEKRWGWCALCTVLAIFAKPAALALPGVYAVLAWGRGEPLLRREVMVPAAAGALACGWSLAVTSQTNPGGLETSLMVPLHNLCWYPLTALVPFETNPFYPESMALDARCLAVLAGGVALLAGGVALARALRCSGRAVLATLATLAAAMLPVLGLLRYTNFRYCDRYNYLVSAVVVAAAVLLAERAFQRWRWPRLRHAVVGTLAAGALLYAASTYIYVPYWENCVRLSYYGLQRPGRPNLKAYELGIMAAFRLGAYEYLDYLRQELPKRPPMTHFPVETSVKTMLTFVDAHQRFLEGDFVAAEENYRRIIEEMALERTRDGQVAAALPEPLVAWLCQDLATIAEHQGDHKKAEFYRLPQK